MYGRAYHVFRRIVGSERHNIRLSLNQSDQNITKKFAYKIQTSSDVFMQPYIFSLLHFDGQSSLSARDCAT